MPSIPEDELQEILRPFWPCQECEVIGCPHHVIVQPEAIEAIRQYAAKERLDEINRMAEYVSTSPFAYPELAGGFANNYMCGRIKQLKESM